MFRLLFKYYLDVTKFNLLFCIFFFIIRPNLPEIAIIFGTVGVFISFMVYSYLQNIEYYFYLNGGLIKRNMQLKVFAINAFIALNIEITLWLIK